MSRSIPACEALAAEWKRCNFRDGLDGLLNESRYDRQKEMVDWLCGYLAALLDADLITLDQHRRMGAEILSIVWGPAQ